MTELEKVKVFLVDNQTIFREGIHFILEGETDMEVVGEGRTADEVLAFLQEQSVDVLVLSDSMENFGNQVSEMFPHVGLLFLGDFHRLSFPADDRRRTRCRL